MFPQELYKQKRENRNYQQKYEKQKLEVSKPLLKNQEIPMRKQHKILMSIMCLLFYPNLFAHGWDYFEPDDGNNSSLCKHCSSNEFILTAIIFLILFLVSIHIRKIGSKKLKLLSNLIIFSSLIYIILISKYPIIDIALMALGFFFFFGLIIILLFFAYIILTLIYKLTILS